MKKGILGKKIGMTQVFNEDGVMVPVTVVEAGPCLVITKKSLEKDGYDAIQIGFADVSARKLNKPVKGQFDKNKLDYKKYVKEFSLKNAADYKAGDEITVNIFKEGDRVDVSGISKGKGFQGVIKRHGASRGPMGHGSMYHRRPGSMGANTSPGRVFKGKILPGHMGNKKVTIQNLDVVRVDEARNLILIKGAVPGNRGSLLVIRESVKNA